MPSGSCSHGQGRKYFQEKGCHRPGTSPPIAARQFRRTRGQQMQRFAAKRKRRRSATVSEQYPKQQRHCSQLEIWTSKRLRFRQSAIFEAPQSQLSCTTKFQCLGAATRLSMVHVAAGSPFGSKPSNVAAAFEQNTLESPTATTLRATSK